MELLKATDAVTFELLKHTSTALIGPNGAGKTTTISMLAGSCYTDRAERFQFQGRYYYGYSVDYRISSAISEVFSVADPHLNLRKWRHGLVVWRRKKRR